MKPAPIDPPEIDNLLWEGFGNPTGIGWDVGANCGQSVPKMIERFGHVICFEPAHESFEVLRRAYGHLGNVTLFEAALSSETGGVDLVQVPEKIATGQLVTANQYPEALPGDKWIVTRHVPSFTGDMFCVIHGQLPPTFMKIDVEGHEAFVLAGCQEILLRHHPSLLIEIHTEQLGQIIFRLLTDLDYTVHTVRHPHYKAGGAFWRGHFWLKAEYAGASGD